MTKMLCVLAIVGAWLAAGVSAQQSSQPIQPSQPVPIKSYDEWALHQEIGCRSTLKTIWTQAATLETERQTLSDELTKLKDELTKLKEAQRAQDVPATN